MGRSALRLIGGATATVALVACGSAGGGGASSFSPPGEETKSAAQIYSDALDAMAKKNGMHLTVVGTSSSGKVTTIDADVTQDAARLTTTGPSGPTVIVVTGGKVYVQVAGKFVEAPGEVSTLLQAATRDKALSCARTEHGTLTKGAVSMLNGHRVITLQDDGKYPGDAPGTTYVALNGAPLLVRTVSKGPVTPGGNPACGHAAQSTDLNQQVDYDYSSGVVTITPPPLPGT